MPPQTVISLKSPLNWWSGVQTFTRMNHSGETALHVAASRAGTTLVKLLLDQDAELEAVDQYGNTPVLIAVRQGRLEVVELFLDYGTDPNAEVYETSTPCRLAQENEAFAGSPLLERLCSAPDPAP